MTHAALATHDLPERPIRLRLKTMMGRLWPTVFLYSLLLIAAIAALKIPTAKDYVGADNDDGMRLIEVRDLLNDQSWFDLHQYRLGLADGTLMHWSRLIDLPLATLIRLFDLFLSARHAEAVALAIWPLVLIVPLMGAMALTGRRIGGVLAMHFCLVLTALFTVTSNRFLPGSIDHHNVQLALVATMLAMLLDPAARPVSLAIAGACAAVAIAIGAETAPFIATISMVIALRWAWEGDRFSRPAAAYGVSLAGFLTLLFLGTVPPHLYKAVTCDNFSLGFYSLACVGGLSLAAAARFGRDAGRLARIVCLGGIGVGVAVTAKLVAPQCLQNPLAGLDPLVVEFWLNSVSEAQSARMIFEQDPGSLGLFYGPGLLASLVCVFRIIRGDRTGLHILMLPLLIVSLAITVLQVRGAMFLNLLSIPPLVLMIIDLRQASNSDRRNVAKACLFIAGVLASAPPVWGIFGFLVLGNLFSTAEADKTPTTKTSCYNETAMMPLAGQTPGLVMAPVDMGVPLLRFTNNRVLSAPYHRNPAGILAQIQIALAEPAQAEKLLQSSGVTILGFCSTDPQTTKIIKSSPGGLYAQMLAGRIPGYLTPIDTPPDAGLHFFRVLP